jgi:hypothetical protein
LRTLFDHRKTGHLFQLYFQLEILRLEGSQKLNGGDGRAGGTMIERCSGGL